MRKRMSALLLAVLLVSLCLTGCRPKEAPDFSDTGSSVSQSQDRDAGQDAGREDIRDTGKDTAPRPEEGGREPAGIPPTGDPPPEETPPEVNTPTGNEPQPEPAQPDGTPSPAEEPPAEEPPAEELPAEELPAEEPSAEGPPSEELPTEEPPAVEEPPAAEEPPVGEPDPTPAPDIDPDIAREIDQSAQALFRLLLKNDPSAMAQLRGCSSEEELLADLGLEGDPFRTVAEGMLSGFQDSPIPLSDEVKPQIIDTVFHMLQKVELTTQVKQLDLEAGTAVVTCTVSSFGSGFLEASVSRATFMLILQDPDSARLLSGGDEAVIFNLLFPRVIQILDGLSPTQTAGFDATFERAGGQPEGVWYPADNGFTDALLSAIAGMPVQTNR